MSVLCRTTVGSLSHRTHIKYQPEDYHRPALSLAGFPASAFCRGSFYREYMHQPALCYFLPFFFAASPFSSRALRTRPTNDPFPTYTSWPRLCRSSQLIPLIPARFCFRSRVAAVTYVPVTYVQRRGIINELCGRELIVAAARNQRYITWLCCCIELYHPLIFLPLQERMSRYTYAQVIYCVACFLSLYLLVN